MIIIQGSENVKEFAYELVPGLRIIKTGIAVFICLITLYWFNHFEPIHAAIACVLMMKSTVEESTQSGVQRTIGTILGGIVSLILINILRYFDIPHESMIKPIVMTLGVVVVLIVSKAAHAASYISSMAAVVLLITMISHASVDDNTLVYVVNRVLETIYGIGIALLVNKYVNFSIKPTIKKTNSV